MKAVWSLWTKPLRENRQSIWVSNSCCVSYHRHQTKSPYKNIHVKCLFPSLDDALIMENAARVGFTHLIADAKQNRKIAEHLEHRVKKDYPKYYYSVINSF